MIIAYYPVHYGLEFLEASIKSIEDAVSKILILYSSKPTYGYNTEVKCPEGEMTINNLVHRISGKIIWVNVTNKHFKSEGEHRGYAESLASEMGATQLLAVDADEVWDINILKNALKTAQSIPCRYINVSNWYHFYRSFDWVCRDGFIPTRITNLTCGNTSTQGTVDGLVYHFGYAQSLLLMHYKWAIHGHKSELRPNWMQEKFLDWKPGMNDVHPVAIGLWNPIRFDKTTLPEILKSHQHYHKIVIV